MFNEVNIFFKYVLMQIYKVVHIVTVTDSSCHFLGCLKRHVTLRQSHWIIHCKMHLTQSLFGIITNFYLLSSKFLLFKMPFLSSAAIAFFMKNKCIRAMNWSLADDVGKHS